ncbi:hypothetical protein JKN53_000108 [Enterococcus faecalis]|jgi:hypothetical protein|uniref:hypothetical protein n=1 Tax=Enterococcus faecalis TaxID=1351 RepID=UPI001430F04B|nr:hypothetical protein [Enterococcus faecalis]EHA4031127.1 hypothetical protein [Enterococcus faecalis]EHY9169210.1 hypothetical protein [Enterococcus faecalis]NJJ99892.1 hypothetical protein [Enterococcus faecalis]DAL40893.1 MAG TPA_asm: hypothetical protein [Caudoviricetes sp.]
MIPKVEIGQVYKLADANPPSFGKINKVTEQQVWEEDCISSKLPDLAWGNWYQWVGEEVYCLREAGFEVTRLTETTIEEVAIYERKVAEYEERGNFDDSKV